MTPSDQKETPLKACPFCGGKAYTNHLTPPQGEMFFISCQSCQMQTIERNNLSAAISAWNTRADQSPQPLTPTAPTAGDVKRYDCDQSEFGCQMFEEKEGGYVHYEDYTALRSSQGVPMKVVSVHCKCGNTIKVSYDPENNDQHDAGGG